TADFRIPDTLCAGHELVFENTSGTPIATWLLDDGSTSKETNLFKSYDKSGFYALTLAVKNIEGCTDTISKSFQINHLDLTLNASKEFAKIGDLVILESHA